MVDVMPEEFFAVDTHRPRRELIPSDRQVVLGEAAGDVHFGTVAAREFQSVGAAVGGGFREVIGALNPLGFRMPRRVLLYFGLGSVFGPVAVDIFTLALPDIEETFGVGITGLSAITSALVIIGYVVSFPFGYLGDRVSRVGIFRLQSLLSVIGLLAQAIPGGAALFTGGNGLFSASGLLNKGASVSYLGDVVRPDSRARFFGFLASLESIGSLLSGTVVGGTITALGFRNTYAVVALPFLGLLVLSLFLREPVRGELDRLELGVDRIQAARPQLPPSFAEGLRASFAIRTLRLQAIAQFVQGLSMPLVLVRVLLLFTRFGLDAAQVGLIVSIQAALQVPAYLASGAVSQRLLNKRPSSVMALQGTLFFIAGSCVLLSFFVHNLIFFTLLSFIPLVATDLVSPAASAVGLLVTPARFRSISSQITTPFIVLAAIVSPILVSQSAQFGQTTIFIVFSPFYFIGGFIYLASAATVTRDISNAQLANMAEEFQEEARLRGADPMLVIRGIEAGYGEVQILFGVDLTVRRGETVALLGTNGAGKSTLLKVICGQLEAKGGAVFFDGNNITRVPTYESAARGVAYMPGGQAVFPGLTVRENLDAARWSRGSTDAEVELALTRFPQLRERLDAVAGSLSGGEQQQLALSQALLMRPELLMIDELSLGLSPTVVETLLELIRELQAAGTTILLVEQSLNVAVSIAERAVFMEKGEIQYDGPTTGLLARPDLVRAVFMGAAGSGSSTSTRARPEGDRDDGPILAAEGLSLSYGGLRALTEVSFSVEPGEVLGIIGPNGAGKTTLFDVLSGQVSPDSGAVLIDAADVTGLTPDARARLGLTRAFQNARLFPPLTVAETISIAYERRANRSATLAALWAPQVRSSEKLIAERVEGLLEILGLTGFSDKFIRELSTGTRRAVEVACMMAAEPKVLLLDEPSSGLAQAESESLAPALRRIVRDTGCALVIIEHDLPLLTSVCDRMLAMERGAVIVTGTPDEVTNDDRVLSSYLAASGDVVSRSGSLGSALAAIVAPTLQPLPETTRKANR